MPEKKYYVNVSKGVLNKNFATYKGLCSLQELYTSLKEKHQMQLLGSQSSVPWGPNGAFWLAQE